MTHGLAPVSVQVPQGRPRALSKNTASPSPSPTSPHDSVKVAVRCRPLFPDRDRTNDSAWRVDPARDHIQLDTATTARRYPANHGMQANYHYDRVFHDCNNEEVYQAMVEPLIQQSMDGYNATVFTYGQTASGKTHTMMGSDVEPGIIPRAVDDVFNYIKMTSNNEFLLRVSYLEIYNETIRDLLAPDNDNLKIHEDPHRGTYVAQATEQVVTGAQQVMDVIRRGETNRHISTTDYNLHSSRSHTLFQMVIESRKPNQHVRSKASVKISQLNLIDLAGSEKAASNQDRRKEGAFINKSLLTLGTVIAKLTEPGRIAGHIPYRDSKLTRLLQSSLSGRARVVVICTISPTLFTVDESINTLKFAARVKKIIVRARNDAVADDKALLQQYRGEIDDLKMKLAAANEGLAQERMNHSMMSHERQQYEQELFQMRLVRTALKERIDHLTQLILTSATVQPAAPSATSPIQTQPQQTNGFSGRDDPWVLVRELRREVQELKLQNEQLRRQVRAQEDELDAISSQKSDHQALVDKVAQLEAELSVTKAELEVTSMMAKEVAHDNRKPPSSPPVSSPKIMSLVTDMSTI